MGHRGVTFAIDPTFDSVTRITISVNIANIHDADFFPLMLGGRLKRAPRRSTLNADPATPWTRLSRRTVSTTTQVRLV
jgi:hypothetical protein